MSKHIRVKLTCEIEFNLEDLNYVSAEDVADAFYHLALSLKTTASVITVDGGNIESSLR